MSEELKPCQFCGGTPDLPSGDGTYYVIECGKCGWAVVGVQISDLMTIEERRGDPFTNYRYAEQYIERAKAEAIKQWNTRATPPAAQVQGEQPEVVGVRYQAHGAGWELMDESPFADGRQNWKQVGEELQALMTVAQHERIVAALEGERAEQWRLRRDFEARFDTQAAVVAELRAALSAPPAADMADAYVGAREDLAIWKRRALEAEEKVRVLDQRIDQLVLDAQGETRMGEPHIAPLAAGVSEYRCHKCGSVTQPPAPYEFSVKCSCGVRTAATAALAAAPTPPASEQQQAVVLPKRDGLQLYAPDSSDYAGGVSWNACLDEFLRLNPHLAGVNQGVTTEAGNGGEA
ncbi:hypothetical protein PSm6_00450 [Pseudomonas solani]|uniref:Restriction alleviation protein Lar n=1 Tax=Pseudomonas solani TaxID=2731552 RepID=A0ABN6BHP3_9PSED|nr:Lar family restriction alleviation protein [Pseudomonas solani]BCD83638.1 hypothetical protein PSm6_00450 [Pseudomonas solani]